MSHILFKYKLLPFSGYRGVMDCDCACADAPDTKAITDASNAAEAAGTKLGQEQIDEARKQFAKNSGVTDELVSQQRGLLQRQTALADSNAGMVNEVFNPLTRKLAADAEAEGSEQRMEEAAGRAAADARVGQTQQAGMMMRQGLRLGYSPARMARLAAEMAGSNASQVASATTNAREAQRQLGWQKGMDVAGMGKDFTASANTGYAAGASTATQAGATQMQPSTQLLSGLAGGADTTMAGHKTKLSGLGAILDSQTSYANQANAAMQSGGGGLGGLGSVMGGAASLYSAFSDPRLKTDVVKVGVDEKTGLNIYEFTYLQDNKRYRGVMADEVEEIMPDAVEHNAYGFASVNYPMLGIEMKEVQ